LKGVLGPAAVLFILNVFAHFIAMPRYFFNTYHAGVHIDDDGEEFPDKHAAWQEATRTAGEAIKDIDGKLQPGQEWKLEVTDEFANVLYVLRVRAEKPR
jgi:hypothetical protein